jgi:hypothetical protein
MTDRPGRELPDHGLPDDELPDPDLLERIWRVLSRWAVPVMMTLAYVLLAATSDTNTAGKTLMGVGLGFVLVVWFVFRALTESAALSRALSVGDVPRLFALADRHLPRTRRPDACARLLVGRALAHQLRGEFAAALATLDQAAPAPDVQPLAQVVRLAAQIELGRAAGEPARPVAEQRGLAVASRAPALAWLAEGQLALAGGDLDAASERFARVIDSIRAGSAARAIAHLYAARIADTRGDAPSSARHRAAATALAAPDARWLHAQSAVVPE